MPQLRNVWKNDAYPFPSPKWMTRGIRFRGRNLTSRAFYPDARQRAIIYGGKYVVPHFLVFDYDLQARDVQDNQNVPVGDHWITGFVANPTDGNIFQSQLVEMMPNGQVNNRLSAVGVNDVNGWGTGTSPMILRFPYHSTNLAPLVQHMVNMANAEHVVQCVVLGYRRRFE
jgi:hypothetical protein